MMEALPHLSLSLPLLLFVLVLGGLALRRWGKGRVPAIGMAVLWFAMAIAIAWFAWSLTQALALVQKG